MKTKKGLSAIVTTLIVILLVLVAVGVVWGVVGTLIDNTTTQVADSQKCLGVGLEITNAECTGGICTVAVRRKSVAASDVEIAGVKLVFSDADGKSEVVTEKGSIEVLGSKVYKSINLIDTTLNPTQVEAIAYFVNDKGDEAICENGATRSIDSGAPIESGTGDGDDEPLAP
jgi:flagellin-like protein